MDPIGGKQNVAPKARPTRDRVRTSAPERQTAALKAAAEAAGPRLLQAARAQQLWIAGPRAVEKRGGSARTGGWSKRAVPTHRPRERNEENLLARQRADDCARKAAGGSAGCTRKKRCTFDPACGCLVFVFEFKYTWSIIPSTMRSVEMRDAGRCKLRAGRGDSSNGAVRFATPLSFLGAMASLPRNADDFLLELWLVILPLQLLRRAAAFRPAAAHVRGKTSSTLAAMGDHHPFSALEGALVDVGLAVVAADRVIAARTLLRRQASSVAVGRVAVRPLLRHNRSTKDCQCTRYPNVKEHQ